MDEIAPLGSVTGLFDAQSERTSEYYVPKILVHEERHNEEKRLPRCVPLAQFYSSLLFVIQPNIFSWNPNYTFVYANVTVD